MAARYAIETSPIDFANATKSHKCFCTFLRVATIKVLKLGVSKNLRCKKVYGTIEEAKFTLWALPLVSI
jgi:hypothetical protein